MIVPKNLAFDDAGFMELPAGLARSSSSLIGDHTLGCCSSSKLCGSALRVSEN